MNCETCQYWGENNPDDSTGRRVCNHRAFAIWSQDRMNPDGANGVAPYRNSKVVTAVVTGPKFGCVHHKPKT